MTARRSERTRVIADLAWLGGLIEIAHDDLPSILANAHWITADQPHVKPVPYERWIHVQIAEPCFKVLLD